MRVRIPGGNRKGFAQLVVVFQQAMIGMLIAEYTETGGSYPPGRTKGETLRAG